MHMKALTTKVDEEIEHYFGYALIGMLCSTFSGFLMGIVLTLGFLKLFF